MKTKIYLDGKKVTNIKSIAFEYTIDFSMRLPPFQKKNILIAIVCFDDDKQARSFFVERTVLNTDAVPKIYLKTTNNEKNKDVLYISNA